VKEIKSEYCDDWHTGSDGRAITFGTFRQPGAMMHAALRLK